MSGTITRLETAATVLESEDRDKVRVPNQLMLDSIVTLNSRDQTDAASPSSR